MDRRGGRGKCGPYGLVCASEMTGLAWLNILLPSDRLLLMNDLINNVLERFEACKRGDWSKAAEIDAT